MKLFQFATSALFLTASLTLGLQTASAKNYGLAGCGLGAVALGPTGPQILAATTNGTSGNQTFGITSGTSNCQEDGVTMVDHEKEYFAEANYDALMQEIAVGHGEHISALAGLYGCRDDAFGASMKINYVKLFPSQDTDAEGMVKSMNSLVTSEPGLQGSCDSVN